MYSVVRLIFEMPNHASMYPQSMYTAWNDAPVPTKPHTAKPACPVALWPPAPPAHARVHDRLRGLRRRDGISHFTVRLRPSSSSLQSAVWLSLVSGSKGLETDRIENEHPGTLQGAHSAPPASTASSPANPRPILYTLETSRRDT